MFYHFYHLTVITKSDERMYGDILRKPKTQEKFMVLGGNINCMRGFYTGISKVQERDFDKVFTSNKETFKAGEGLDH